MAAINSVPKSIHLPLAGLNAPRVLMCHASVGTDNSVTLKLRDANGVADTTHSTTSSTALENVLIGYTDADMIADVLGTLQTASLKNSNTNKLANALTTAATTTATTTSTVTTITSATTTTITTSDANVKDIIARHNSYTTHTSNSNTNSISNAHAQVSKITATGVVATPTNNKTNSYIKNCLIRSSGCSNNNNNLTSLAQIMSNSSSNHSHSSNHSTNSTTSSTSTSSNFSSNSNDSISSSSNNSTSGIQTNNKNVQNVPGCVNPPKSVKKNRSKALSPTRHGPQQCQICNKIFGNASALAKHKLTHSDERKYVCSMCTKAFKRQDHLNGHMMTHRNKKPYECKAEGCNKSYCDARSLRRHTENHHAGITTKNQISAQNGVTSTSNGCTLSPTGTSADINSMESGTCLRTYIANGSSLVDANTGETLSDDKIKTISLPINTTVSLLSPASSSSSNGGGTNCSTTCSNITVAEAPFEGEGLTPKQLDLISQIMQRTKQTNAQVTVSSPTSVNSYKIATTNALSDSAANSTNVRPRTWNMQLLNQSKNISITVDEIASVELFTKNENNNEQLVSESKSNMDEDINLQTGTLVHTNLLKTEQKPVECNLCHRKFKNIPALNGHMRLHGGYFKKDPDAKKNEKKESNGPPLQTASIGVRALIEEKIISKRGKDLNKSAFIVPAPPGSTSSLTTNRRNNEREMVSNIKQQSTSNIETNITGRSKSPNNSLGNGAITTTIQLPSATTIINNKQQKSSNSVNVGTSSISSGTKTISYFPTTATTTATATVINSIPLIKTATSELKDSTLIELLKRGTRVAVTQRKPPNSTNLILNNTDLSSKVSNNKSIEIANATQIISGNNRTLIIPADIHMVTKPKNDLNGITSASIHLTDGTPVALTIANDNDMTALDDTFTVAYAEDEAQLYTDNGIYNISDSEMLVNTVESMQFMSESGAELKSEHSEHFTINENDDVNHHVVMSSNGTLERFVKMENSQVLNEIEGTAENYVSTTAQMQTEINSNVPTTPLPNFQQFHSKEIIMQTTAQLQALTNNSRSNTLTLPSFTSPIHSPLQYPTPPSSHENVTQSSPFIDDRNNSYVDGTTTSNAFFGEKCSMSDFLGQTEHSSNFLKSEPNVDDLQSSLIENATAFDTAIKVEDLLSGSQDGTECDLTEFSETNLSFLDDDQLFLNETQNETKSFYTSSVDDVKRMLRDVLCEENVIMNSNEQRNELNVDLCYITGVGMMSNSDDPLLSSCSHEFGQRLQQQEQNEETFRPQATQSLLQQQLQQQSQTQKSETQLQTTTSQNLEQKHIQLVIQNSIDVQQLNNSEKSYISSNKLTKEALLQHTKQFQQQHEQIDEENNKQNKTNLINDKSKAVEQTLNADSIITSEDSMQWEVHNGNESTNLSNFPLFPVASISATVISLLQPISNQTKSMLKRRFPSPDASNAITNAYNMQTTYHSKLRKPTRTHYTPPPMLNPDREGLGLYSCVRKQLNGGTLPFETFNSDDFSDHIGLAVFSDESKVNLGSDYQAQIPQLKQHNSIANSNDVTEPLNADLMWDPKVQIDQSALRRYIELSKSASEVLGSHSEEDALYTLLKSKGTIATAVLTLLQTRSKQLKTAWSSNDIEIFLRSLENYGKDFSKIATKLGNKTTGDCVQMYYFWKRTCVEHKTLETKNNFRKNTCRITTDYLKTALKQSDKLKTRLKINCELAMNKCNVENVLNIEKPTHKTEDSVTNNNNNNNNNNVSLNQTDTKRFVCEIPDCSASFMSKAALHGHTRIHSTSAKNDNNNAQNICRHTPSPNNACAYSKTNNQTNANLSNCSASPAQLNSNHINSKDVNLNQYPCKMCGKIFSKVKSRSAHMKTHRSQELPTPVLPQNQSSPQIKQSQQQTEILRLLQTTTPFSLKLNSLEHTLNQQLPEHVESMR